MELWRPRISSRTNLSVIPLSKSLNFALFSSRDLPPRPPSTSILSWYRYTLPLFHQSSDLWILMFMTLSFFSVLFNWALFQHSRVISGRFCPLWCLIISFRCRYEERIIRLFGLTAFPLFGLDQLFVQLARQIIDISQNSEDLRLLGLFLQCVSDGISHQSYREQVFPPIVSFLKLCFHHAVSSSPKSNSETLQAFQTISSFSSSEAPGDLNALKFVIQCHNYQMFASLISTSHWIRVIETLILHLFWIKQSLDETSIIDLSTTVENHLHFLSLKKRTVLRIVLREPVLDNLEMGLYWTSLLAVKHT